VEEVDVKELMSELEKRQELNKVRNLALLELGTLDENIKLSTESVRRLLNELSLAEDQLAKDHEARHDKANEIQKMKIANEQEVKDQIESAQAVNQKAVNYEKLQADKDNLYASMRDLTIRANIIKQNESDRVKYLKSLKLPWPNITINDDGEFRINGKPFANPYFSTGELLKMGAKIGSKLKDGLKYVFFPNSEALDDANREAVFKALNDDGFQVVAESVGTEKKKATSILLREMMVVESYDGAKESGLR